jgi:predicted enzyme related to lactoylglutathione lyase
LGGLSFARFTGFAEYSLLSSLILSILLILLILSRDGNSYATKLHLRFYGGEWSMKYVHTNVVARDWKRLAAFYQEVFGCVPVPPERDLSGEWLDRATGIDEAHILGIHLRLPGYGDSGPTLEIFQFRSMSVHAEVKPNTPGFSHIAFAVDDVAATAQSIFDHGGSPVVSSPCEKCRGSASSRFNMLLIRRGISWRFRTGGRSAANLR